MNPFDTPTLIVVGIGIVALLVLAVAVYTRRARAEAGLPVVAVKLLPESYLIYNGDLLVDAAAFVEVHNLSEHPVQVCPFKLKVGKHLLHMIETKGQALPFDLPPNQTERFKFRKRNFCDVPDAIYDHTITAVAFFTGADAETYSSGKQNIQVYREE